MAIVLSIRSITLSDLINNASDQNRLESILANNLAAPHSALRQLSQTADLIGAARQQTPTLDNHAFYSTHTQLCFIPDHPYHVEKKDTIFGKVRPVIHAKVSPGHLKPFSEAINESGLFSDTNSFTDTTDTSYVLASPGQEDIAAIDARPLLTSFRSLQDVVSARKRILKHLFHANPPSQYFGSSSSFNFSLEIPVPTLETFSKDVLPGHFQPAFALREFTTNSLRQTNQANSNTAGKAIPRTDLNREMRKALVPPQVRRELSRVYLEYEEALLNPELSHVVIDLFPFFRAATHLFYNIATTPERVSSSFKVSEKISTIISIVDSLKLALKQRTQNTAIRTEEVSSPLDIPGGLSKPLAGCEVFITCMSASLTDLLPQVATPGHTIFKTNTFTAAISSLTTTQRPRACTMNASYPPKHETLPPTRFDLAIISISPLHLLQPSSWTAYIHEMAHLAIPTALQNSLGHKLSDTLRERMHEMFAETVVHKLVFQDDSILYAKHYTNNYWLHTDPSKSETEDLDLPFMEVLMRLFFVIDILSFISSGSDSPYLAPKVSNNTRRLLLRRFETFIKSDAIRIPHFRTRFAPTNRAFQLELLRSFRRYRKTMHSTVQRAVGLADLIRPPQDPPLTSAQLSDLSSGIPIVPNSLLECAQDTEELHPKVFAHACKLIYHYIKRTESNLSADTNMHSFHLTRDENGLPTFPSHGAPYPPLLLDRALSDYFVLDPNIGERQLCMSVATIKSLSSMSCALRGWLFSQLLNSAQSPSSPDHL